MENKEKDILDSPQEKIEVSHDISIGKNKVVLGGVFAWIFYAQMTILFIKGFISLLKDLFELIHNVK
jgi:hypothetical protein